MRKYKLNDIVVLKKPHPCGENTWKITRFGVDMKLTCMGCNKDIWIRRIEFDKKIRKIKNKDGKFISIVNYNPDEDI